MCQKLHFGTFLKCVNLKDEAGYCQLTPWKTKTKKCINLLFNAFYNFQLLKNAK